MSLKQSVGVPPVESPGLGVCILTKDTEEAKEELIYWRYAVDALEVAIDAWDWLRASGRPTMPAISLEMLAEAAVARCVERCRDAGVLLHLVRK